MFDGNMFLPETGTPISRSIAAAPCSRSGCPTVDGGDLDAEVVDDALRVRGRLLFLNREICR
jgi:hypothetical protein